jgi:hypothetical protein
VDVHATFDADCDPSALFGCVSDLSDYPEWFGLVHQAALDPLHLELAVRDDGEVPMRRLSAASRLPDRPAWLVDLRGRLGPMARSKRLRMVRTLNEPPRRVRFDRVETDGRRHAEWVLDATVTPEGNGARLAVHLHYSGTFGGVLLRRMLEEEIERARPRLAAFAAERLRS